MGSDGGNNVPNIANYIKPVIVNCLADYITRYLPADKLSGIEVTPSNITYYNGSLNIDLN